ncbi:FtsP/CotA-like multicopper oxidase with cupredoxin domain [Nitrobacteraceae bacterium AZCC 1564]
MTNQLFLVPRRAFLAGLGGFAVTSGLRYPAAAQGRPALSLRLRPGTAKLVPNLPDSPIWAFDTGTPEAPLRFRRNDELQVTFTNNLPVPAALNWAGIDGAQATAPLIVQGQVPASGRADLAIPLRHAGTFLLESRLLGDAKEHPSLARALIVEESEKIAVDRDEVLLIEDWRVKSDGRAIAPGTSTQDTTVTYTVNGRPNLDLSVRANERLRLRFINGCQRAPIGLKVEKQEVRVMAIDGQPAEPFSARDGQVVLPPSSRVDVFIDVTGAPGTTSSIMLHDGTAAKPIARLTISKDAPLRPVPLPAAAPLPSNGLPARLDLQGALRTDLSLDPKASDPKASWVAPANLVAASAPACRAKRGRTVVMAITNPTPAPVTFRLQGHHFRLLDRLDDGWKPFWLDTLLVTPGQTQRIAFAAEHGGKWLMEAIPIDWAAPRLIRWYLVE